MDIPCKDCISLPVCKNRLVNLMEKHDIMFIQDFDMVVLRSNCEILDEYAGNLFIQFIKNEIKREEVYKIKMNILKYVLHYNG